jgi:hypothetical protein
MGAKGFGAGNFKSLFESIERRHCERYKNRFLHYVKNNQLGLLLAMLC